MNYLEAKSELLQGKSRVSFLSMAIEVVAMIGIAGLLVLFFA